MSQFRTAVLVFAALLLLIVLFVEFSPYRRCMKAYAIEAQRHVSVSSGPLHCGHLPF